MWPPSMPYDTMESSQRHEMLAASADLVGWVNQWTSQNIWLSYAEKVVTFHAEAATRNTVSFLLISMHKIQEI